MAPRLRRTLVQYNIWQHEALILNALALKYPTGGFNGAVSYFMQQTSHILQQQTSEELQNILQYWMLHTIDEANGGFYGSVRNDNSVHTNAAKGVVLNARILWTFSAAYNIRKDDTYLTVAKRSVQYIVDHFYDKEYGGVYWSVDTAGHVLESRKQIYGLAFCIYGLSEFNAATKDDAALNYAVQLYSSIEQHSYDAVSKGYMEAFTRQWEPLDDLRLSAKDANEKKTMNTHLHLIEAYANLYKVWRNEALKEKIEGLLYLFDTYFIDHNTWHLRLFFDEKWNEKAGVVSYGHDIEAAWLLLRCAESIAHDKWVAVFQQYALSITEAAIGGMDADGGLWYEYDLSTKQLIKEKHWWPQAEALVGFYNAYQLSNNAYYLELALKSWAFIQKNLLDKTYGEWYWGIHEDYSIMQNQDKAGFWKCPYHNARACMEIMQRVEKGNTAVL